jgi:hypothetical protein
MAKITILQVGNRCALPSLRPQAPFKVLSSNGAHSHLPNQYLLSFCRPSLQSLHQACPCRLPVLRLADTPNDSRPLIIACM